MADRESCGEEGGPEGGNGAPFGDQEAVGGDAECGVMVEAAPPAPFIITKAEFLFELLVIALDPPSQLCQINQAVEGGILGQGGEPILGGFCFVIWPLDQQPLFSAQLAHQVITMRRPHPPPGKARRQPIRGSLAPGDRLPRLLRQAESKCLDRDRLVLPITLKPLLWSSAPRSSLRRQRGCARWPDRGVGTDPCHIPHADGGDLRSQAG